MEGNLRFSRFVFLFTFSLVAFASSDSIVSMISFLGFKRGCKKTGNGQGQSPMQGGQGEAGWIGIYSEGYQQ